MDVFDKFFDMDNENGSGSEQNGSLDSADGPLTASVLLVYENFKQIDLKPVTTFRTKSMADSENQVFADYELEGHEIQLFALNESLPANLLDFVLPICHFQESEKDRFRSAQAHIILFYKGRSDSMEKQLEALYKFTNLIKGNLIGLINENAWTAHPAIVLDEVATAKNLEGLDFSAWFAWTGGLVKYFMPDGETVWYASKGNHQFGLKEFALKGDTASGEDTLELFYLIFNYCYTNKLELNPGETMTVKEDVFISISELVDYYNHLNGELGTVVLEKKPIGDLGHDQ